MNELTDEMKRTLQRLKSFPDATVSHPNELYALSNPGPWMAVCNVRVSDVLELARHAMTDGERAELEAWREIGRRFYRCNHIQHARAGSGSVLLTTFHAEDEAPTVFDLIKEVLNPGRSNLATDASCATTTPEPDTADASRAYEALAEFLAVNEVRTMKPAHITGLGGCVALIIGDMSKRDECEVLVMEAQAAYLAAHPPVPLKDPRDRALDLLETSYRLGREGSEDAAAILRDAGRL